MRVLHKHRTHGAGKNQIEHCGYLPTTLKLPAQRLAPAPNSLPAHPARVFVIETKPVDHISQSLVLKVALYRGPAPEPPPGRGQYLTLTCGISEPSG